MDSPLVPTNTILPGNRNNFWVFWEQDQFQVSHVPNFHADNFLSNVPHPQKPRALPLDHSSLFKVLTLTVRHPLIYR